MYLHGKHLNDTLKMVSLVIHKTRMMSESQQVCYDKICRLTKIA